MANWVQGGPEWVRDIPLKAKDAKILLVRRFPKDANRKQRVPFLVSAKRLIAGLRFLLENHKAFQENGLTAEGVRVSMENLDEYSFEPEEPGDLDIHVVEQRQDLLMDQELFTKCIYGVYELSLIHI